jgi:hypothetical protein
MEGERKDWLGDAEIFYGTNKMRLYQSIFCHCNKISKVGTHKRRDLFGSSFGG